MIVEESHIILPSADAELEIVYLGDLHVGARACHEERLLRDLKKIKQRENAYVIFMGDQVDAIVPKDTRRFTLANLPNWILERGINEDPEKLIDAVINAQEDRLYDIIDDGFGPPEEDDHVLGMGEGNHEVIYVKFHNHDITKAIANRRNYKMLGFTHFLTLVVGFQDHPRTFRVGLYGHHGWGGGSRTEGYNLTKFSKHMPYFDARIYAFSHVHDIQTKIIPRLEPVVAEKWDAALHSDERILFNDMALIVTGTYLRTLSKGRFPTYSEEKGFPPRKLGYASALVNFDVDSGGIEIGYAVR